MKDRSHWLSRIIWLFPWLPLLFGTSIAIQPQLHGILILGWIPSVVAQYAVGIAFLAKRGPFSPKPGQMIRPTRPDEPEEKWVTA